MFPFPDTEEAWIQWVKTSSKNTLAVSPNHVPSNSRGVTVLMLACKFGSLSLVQSLVSTSLDLNPIGEEVLLFACYSMDVRIFDLIYSLNPSVASLISAKHPFSELFMIIDSPEILERVLKLEGIDINEINDEGDTFLHQLCFYTPQSPLANVLLAHPRLNPNIVNKHGYTPLHLLFKQRKVEDRKLIPKLLELPTINPYLQDNYGFYPFDY